MNSIWEFHFDGTFTPCDIPEVNRVFEEDSDVPDSLLGKHGFALESAFMQNGADGGGSATEAKLWINTSLNVWLIGLFRNGWVACRDMPSFLEFSSRYKSFLFEIWELDRIEHLRQGKRGVNRAPDGSWTLANPALSPSSCEHLLECPVCEHSNTHILGAYRLGRTAACSLGEVPGPIEAEVHEDTQSAGNTRDSRQSALAVSFWCEQGHRFRLIVQQCEATKPTRYSENFMFYQALDGQRWVDIDGGSIPGSSDGEVAA